MEQGCAGAYREQKRAEVWLAPRRHDLAEEGTADSGKKGGKGVAKREDMFEKRENEAERAVYIYERESVSEVGVEMDISAFCGLGENIERWSYEDETR